MFQSREEIWQELEETVEQLLNNASKLKGAILTPNEYSLLQKTQESLFAKLQHTQELLPESKHKKRALLLQEKLSSLHDFSLEFSSSFPHASSQHHYVGYSRVRIGRNRKNTEKNYR